MIKVINKYNRGKEMKDNKIYKLDLTKTNVKVLKYIDSDQGT